MPQWCPLPVTKGNMFHASSIPVLKDQHTYQSNGFEANSIQTSYSHHNKYVGNEFAAWGTPLLMCSSLTWGQKLNLAYPFKL